MGIKSNSIQNLKELLKDFKIEYIVGPKGARFILEHGEIERLYWNEEWAALANYSSNGISVDDVDVGSAHRRYYKLEQIREVFYPDVLAHWIKLHNEGKCQIMSSIMETKSLKTTWNTKDTFEYGLCYEVDVKYDDGKSTKLYYNAFGEALAASSELGVEDKSLLDVTGILMFGVNKPVN